MASLETTYHTYLKTKQDYLQLKNQLGSGGKKRISKKNFLQNLQAKHRDCCYQLTYGNHPDQLLTLISQKLEKINIVKDRGTYELLRNYLISVLHTSLSEPQILRKTAIENTRLPFQLFGAKTEILFKSLFVNGRRPFFVYREGIGADEIIQSLIPEEDTKIEGMSDFLDTIDVYRVHFTRGKKPHQFFYRLKMANKEDPHFKAVKGITSQDVFQLCKLANFYFFMQYYNSSDYQGLIDTYRKSISIQPIFIDMLFSVKHNVVFSIPVSDISGSEMLDLKSRIDALQPSNVQQITDYYYARRLIQVKAYSADIVMMYQPPTMDTTKKITTEQATKTGTDTAQDKYQDIIYVDRGDGYDTFFFGGFYIPPTPTYYARPHPETSTSPDSATESLEDSSGRDVSGDEDVPDVGEVSSGGEDASGDIEDGGGKEPVQPAEVSSVEESGLDDTSGEAIEPAEVSSVEEISMEGEGSQGDLEQIGSEIADFTTSTTESALNYSGQAVSNVGDFFTDIGDGMGNFSDNAVDALGHFADAAVDLGESGLGFLGDIGQSVLEFGGEAFSLFENILGETLSSVVGALETTGTVALDVLDSLGGGIPVELPLTTSTQEVFEKIQTLTKKTASERGGKITFRCLNIQHSPEILSYLEHHPQFPSFREHSYVLFIQGRVFSHGEELTGVSPFQGLYSECNQTRIQLYQSILEKGVKKTLQETSDHIFVDCFSTRYKHPGRLERWWRKTKYRTIYLYQSLQELLAIDRYLVTELRQLRIDPDRATVIWDALRHILLRIHKNAKKLHSDKRFGVLWDKKKSSKHFRKLARNSNFQRGDTRTMKNLLQQIIDYSSNYLVWVGSDKNEMRPSFPKLTRLDIKVVRPKKFTGTMMEIAVSLQKPEKHYSQINQYTKQWFKHVHSSKKPNPPSYREYLLTKVKGKYPLYFQTIDVSDIRPGKSKKIALDVPITQDVGLGPSPSAGKNKLEEYKTQNIAVLFYSLEGCPYCAKTQELLDSNKIQQPQLKTIHVSSENKDRTKKEVKAILVSVGALSSEQQEDYHVSFPTLFFPTQLSNIHIQGMGLQSGGPQSIDQKGLQFHIENIAEKIHREN